MRFQCHHAALSVSLSFFVFSASANQKNAIHFPVSSGVEHIEFVCEDNGDVNGRTGIVLFEDFQSPCTEVLNSVHIDFPSYSVGCQDPEACNYNADATGEDGSCIYPEVAHLDCNGDCINDINGNGVCDEVEASVSHVYNPDWNGDYCYTVVDLTQLLCLFGTCGQDMSGAEGYNPFVQPNDSCFSAFDVTAFLAIYGICLDIPGQSADNGDGSNEDGVMNDNTTNDDATDEE